MLYDGRTGVQHAILDGNTITTRRTVAALALAADYLARKDARRLLVLGAGRVASLIWVIIPLVRSRLLDRTMLYTAITRAVETVVSVGDPDLLNEVISMAPRSLQRNSSLNFETQ